MVHFDISNAFFGKAANVLSLDCFKHVPQRQSVILGIFLRAQASASALIDMRRGLSVFYSVLVPNDGYYLLRVAVGAYDSNRTIQVSCGIAAPIMDQAAGELQDNRVRAEIECQELAFEPFSDGSGRREFFVLQDSRTEGVGDLPREFGKS